MNLLFCSHNGHLEDSSISLIRLATACKRNNHKCTVLLGTKGLLEHFCKKSDLPYVVIPDLCAEEIPHEFLDMLKSKKPDLVMANTVWSKNIVQECKQRSIPIIWMIREPLVYKLEKQIQLAHSILSYANAVIFTSETLRIQYSVDIFENTHVIPNGITFEEIETYCDSHSKAKLRDQFNIPKEATVFVSTDAFHSPEKLKTLFESGIKLIKENPKQLIHFIISGTVHCTDQQREIDYLIMKTWKCDIRQNFHVYEGNSASNEFLRLSDVYIGIAASADCPQSILEAMAYGLPVIANNTCGIAEIIEDTQTGLLFSERNTKELSVHMNKLLRNKLLRSSISKNGKQRIENSFTIQKTYQHYELIMKRIVGKEAENVSIRNTTTHQADDVSLIVRASRPDTLLAAIASAQATFPNYRECIIAAAPSLPRTIIEQIITIPRARIIHGTNVREDATDLHFRLLSECNSSWIANVDDDDLWVSAPSLHSIPKDVGLIYGYYLYINYYLQNTDKNHIALERGHPCLKPADANGIKGSSWIMRASAWHAVASKVTAHPFQHSDWRMYYHIIREGWKTQYIPETLGIVRRFSFDFPTGKSVPKWSDVAKKLDEQHSIFGKDKIDAKNSQSSTQRKLMPKLSQKKGQGSISLIVRASRPDTLPAAITAAQANFPKYHECIIAAAPSLPKSTIQQLRTIPRVRIIPGTDKRDEAGEIHYQLLDECNGEWIVNVDDDDLWLFAPSFKNIDENVGLIHGHSFYINLYLPNTHPRHFDLGRGHTIKKPSEADGVRGSFWIIRTEAWKAISPKLTDRSFYYSDWRIFYHLIHEGWEAKYIKDVLGVFRRFSFNFPTGKETIKWEDVAEKLDSQYNLSIENTANNKLLQRMCL